MWFFFFPASAVAEPKAEEVPIEAPKPLTVEDKVLLAFPDAPVMLKVAYCESGNNCKAPINPLAKNPNSSASGVFQIIKGTWKAYGCTGDVLNADDNIACAKKIYADSGTTPWNASRAGWVRGLDVSSGSVAP
jgi:hypothetical protein